MFNKKDKKLKTSKSKNKNLNSNFISEKKYNDELDYAFFRGFEQGLNFCHDSFISIDCRNKNDHGKTVNDYDRCLYTCRKYLKYGDVVGGIKLNPKLANSYSMGRKETYNRLYQRYIPNPKTFVNDDGDYDYYYDKSDFHTTKKFLSDADKKKCFEDYDALDHPDIPC